MPHFTHTSPLDDDCRYPVVATWTIHYSVVHGELRLGEFDLDEVRVYLTLDIGLLVEMQTADTTVLQFEKLFHEQLDRDILIQLAQDDWDQHQDEWRDVA